MSRRDVVESDKNTFKVLVNFIQRGVSVHAAKLANRLAQQLHDKSPHSELYLFTA